jgi:hypothetical protein
MYANLFPNFFKYGSTTNARAAVDVNGVLIVGKGAVTSLNVTSTAVIKSGSGRIVKLIVNTLGSGSPAVYDGASTSGNTAANLIYSITTTGVIDLDFPVASGIVIAPGTSGVISVSYE